MAFFFNKTAGLADEVPEEPLAHVFNIGGLFLEKGIIQLSEKLKLRKYFFFESKFSIITIINATVDPFLEGFVMRYMRWASRMAFSYRDNSFACGVIFLISSVLVLKAGEASMNIHGGLINSSFFKAHGGFKKRLFS
jgi:hypothetical protein